MANEYAAAISREMNLGPRQAGAIVRMLDDGLPIPFIARYRKEQAGSADEATLMAIRTRLATMKDLDQRKAELLHKLGLKSEAAERFQEMIVSAEDDMELSDIVLHLEAKNRTDEFSKTAAKILENQPSGITLNEITGTLSHYLDHAPEFRMIAADYEIRGVDDSNRIAAEYLLAALVEQIGSSPKARRLVRQRFVRQSFISINLQNPELLGTAEAAPYTQLIDRTEILRTFPAQRMLLLRKGCEDHILDFTIDINSSESEASADLKGRQTRMFVRSTLSPELSDLVALAVDIAYETWLSPDISSEMFTSAVHKAEDAAIDQMGDNLKSRLMGRPLSPVRRVMGVFPESSDLVHVVCLDPGPTFSDASVIAVATLRPMSDPYGSAEHLGFLIERNMIEALAIAEMPGAKGFETTIRNLGLPRPVEIHYLNARLCEVLADTELASDPVLASSQDAVYSRPIAAGRLLIDPLIQLVKVEPELIIDPSLHPAEVDQKMLRQRLMDVEMACVCTVGPDPNTASVELLRLIPGITPKLAEYIVEYRTDNGPFTDRQSLLNVPRMGTKAFSLCSGFLRIQRSANPLDSTFIHPERYEDLENITNDMGITVERLLHGNQLQNALAQTIPTYANRHLNASTLKFIVESLKLNNGDPRMQSQYANATVAGGPVQDNPQRLQRVNNTQGASTQQAAIDPEFLSTLHIGQIIEGRVSHLASYGAFVNIGHNTSGLLHVSQMSDDFVSSPSEILHSGQVLKVKIIDIDPRLLRIALTLRGVKQD